MKRRMGRALFGAVYLCANFCVGAAALPEKSAPDAKIVTKNAPVAEKSSTPELEVLKAQVQLMKEYHERILDTVYWALGVVTTLTIGLLAFGWWTNVRVNEREFRSLSETLNKQITTEAEDLRANNAKNLEAIRDSQDKTIEARANAAAEKHFASKVQPALTRLDTAIVSAVDRVGVLEYQRETAEAEYWMQKEVFMNGISVYTRAAYMCLQTKAWYEFGDSLQGMLTAFRAQVATGERSTVDDGTLDHLNEVLAKAPTKFAGLVDAIKVEWRKIT